MPIKVSGNSASSHGNSNKIDTSLFVQKPYLKTNLIGKNLEEDTDMKNQFRIKFLKDHRSMREAALKIYVDILFTDLSIIRNTSHVHFKDKKLYNVTIVKVNSLPAINQHLTPKQYVDDAIDESTKTKNNQKSVFTSFNLTNISSITLNNQAIFDIEVITNPYVDHFEKQTERSRRHLGLDFFIESSDLVKNNQDKNFADNKLTNLDSLEVKRDSSSDIELANKNML